MRTVHPIVSFRPMVASDLPMLHNWLGRPHVAEWWGDPPSFSEVATEYMPYTVAGSTTRAYIASVPAGPIGYIQSYVVTGSGGGWWEDETDPGARGIDQFLANSEQLGYGLGTALVRAFVHQLFEDPAVTQVQTDPSPRNRRAIRCYQKAGFALRGEVITPDGPAVLMFCKRTNNALP
jgi:RimJ/RimL family protein N-acetyltransferase